MNLRNFDLNLLVVFDAIMRSRNVTRAAEVINLSQPAMSHALKRLRSQLGDPLLVRTTKGMQPTPRALELEGKVRAILKQLDNSLSTNEVFTPEHSQKRFVICATNYFEVTIFPDLVDHLRSCAPGIEVELQLLRSDFPEQALESGDIDLIVGVAEYLENNNRVRSQPLLQDSLTCLVGKRCSFQPEHNLTLDDFVSMTHVYPSPLGVRANLVETWLLEQGLSRKIAATTQSYQAAAFIASKTDYALSLPLGLAEKMAPLYDLKILSPPPDFPKFQMDLIWHPLYDNDPSIAWLKNEVLNVVENNG